MSEGSFSYGFASLSHTYFGKNTGRICKIVAKPTANVPFGIHFIASFTLGGLGAVIIAGSVAV
jgi:hypothetical protein